MQINASLYWYIFAFRSDAAGLVVGADGADDVGGLSAAAEGVKDGGYILGDTQRY